MATEAELLGRYRPSILYDSLEAFFCDSPEEMTADPGGELRQARRGKPDGTLLASVRGIPRQLAIALLRSGPYPGTGTSPDPEDYLTTTGRDYRARYARLRTANPDLRNRIYGRTQRDGDGRLWLQYWFFYYYNDYWQAGGFGLHEGDWEMIQLRVSPDGETPDLAVYAQHAYAGMRLWDEVEKAPDGRPLVYSARGSHASYFEPGLYATEGWYDVADGKRPGPNIELVDLDATRPPWAEWPGRWGGTQPEELGALESSSPSAPCRHDQWRDPKPLADAAKYRAPETPPPQPDISVAIRGAALQVTWDFTKDPPGNPPVKIVVNVNSPDEKQVAPRAFDLDVEGRATGSEPLPGLTLDAGKRYEVYSSAVPRQGAPSASHYARLNWPDDAYKPTLLGRIGVAFARIRAAVGRLLAAVRGWF